MPNGSRRGGGVAAGDFIFAEQFQAYEVPKLPVAGPVELRTEGVDHAGESKACRHITAQPKPSPSPTVGASGLLLHQTVDSNLSLSYQYN